MSENTVNAALRGIGYSKEEMTSHGFRVMARTMLDEVLGGCVGTEICAADFEALWAAVVR